MACVVRAQALKKALRSWNDRKCFRISRGAKWLQPPSMSERSHFTLSDAKLQYDSHTWSFHPIIFSSICRPRRKYWSWTFPSLNFQQLECPRARTSTCKRLLNSCQGFTSTIALAENDSQRWGWPSNCVVERVVIVAHISGDGRCVLLLVTRNECCNLLYDLVFNGTCHVHRLNVKIYFMRPANSVEIRFPCGVI